MLKWLSEGLSWRWQIAQRKLYLHSQFQNSEELIRSYLARKPCQAAVCRDGTVIRHPNRTGLAQTILEIWFEQVYTGAFYCPRPGDTIVDAGANVGLFSLWIARTCPGCRVLAFEAFAENFRLLEANLAAGKTCGVEAFPTGLAGKIGFAMMHDGGMRSLDHRLEVLAEARTDKSDIRTISFSEVIRMAGGAVALFKCDIEGSEYDLFESAEPQDLRAVSRYAIEYHDILRPGTLDLLRRRLASTHDILTRPARDPGYGMLYATVKSLPSLSWN
jgi:FkbM family methyltransferase